MLDDDLLVVDGVAFVRRWQLDAHDQGRKRESFDKRIQLVIDAQWIIDQGIAPERLTLYTRADSSQPWETVPTVHYDERQRAFIAHTIHFSEYGLGLAQGVVGESLPDVSAFHSDLQVGAATVNYPIAVPTGPGGMAPALGLHYSSATVDNFRLSNYENGGADRYRVQAGIAGLGWNLSALNYIAYIDNGTDTDKPEDDRYSLVLNGTSNIFEKGQEVTESFAKLSHWLTKGTLGKFGVQETGEWTITTVDGTKHYFGGEAIQSAALSTTANQAVMIHNCGQYTQHHVVNKWYLRKSVDLNGNAVAYHYHSPTRQLYDCGRASYHRAILPTLIQWGGNETVNSPHTMQVRFIYEGRDDWQIWGTDRAYAQSMYSDVRLKQIFVEVAVNGGWHQLRQYQLNYQYTQPPAGLQHSWLQEIQQYGVKDNGTRTDTPLNTYRFDYLLGAVHSEVYLLHADNGQGGRVTYHYETPAIWACYIDRETECNPKAYRRQVTSKTVYDGTSRESTGRPAGNYTHTRYAYDEGLYRKYKNDPIEFLGYAAVRTYTYARNTLNDEARVTEHWFYRDNGTANQVNANDGYTVEERSRIAANPDPRLGRLSYERTLEPNLDFCRKDANTQLPLYSVVLPDPEGKDLLLCPVTETTNADSAHMRNATGEWVATTNYNDRPRWVRRDYTFAWLDGTINFQTFTYDKAKQGGHQFGNVTRHYEHVGSFESRTTETEYFPNVAKNIVSLPARVRTFNDASQCMTERRYVYDGAYDGTHYVGSATSGYATSPTNGLLMKEEIALDKCDDRTTINTHDAAWAVTRYTYDRYGNQTAVTQTGVDSNHDQVMHTVYDDLYHRFPIRRYLAGNQSHVETLAYYGVLSNGVPSLSTPYAAWGKVAESCVVNDVCTRVGYDDYGRIKLQWNGIAEASSWSGNTTESANIYWVYELYGTEANGVTLLRNMVIEWHAPRCYGNFTRKVYNGLGQLIQEQRPQQDWRHTIDGCAPGIDHAEVDVHYAYDALGNQTRAGVPKATSAFHYNRTTDWSEGYTNQFFDVLGRPRITIAPNGETHLYDYVGRAASVVAVGRYGDPDKVVKWTQRDGFGNLKYLRTYNRVGTQWAFEGEIRLVHDVLGNLVAVYRDSQPNGGTSTQLAQMHYDAAGRKLEMTDADLGKWTYDYDRQGRLTEQTDARGCITYLDYDNLGRLTQKRLRKAANSVCITGNDGEEETTYFYDQGHGLLHDQQINRSRGQLTTVSRNGYTKQLYYNAQGLLHQEIVTIAGLPSQSMRYGYDAHLRPTTTTYPDGEVVSTAYNSMGLPAKLQSSQLGDLVDGTINVFAVSDAVDYDEAGRLTQMRFPAGSPSASSGQALWQTRTYHPWSSSSGNGNGRLWEIRVGTGGDQRSSSNYDKLRLGYAYDSFGNISAGSEQFNLGSWPQYRHCYDGQNRLTEGYALYGNRPTTAPACSNVSNGERFSYDAQGNFRYFETTASSYQYSTPKDGANPHAVKWINIGQGSTTNGTVKIRAFGSRSSTGWPTMELWVNGVKRQTWTVSNTSWSDYTASVPLTGRDQIDIVFPNDSGDGGLDRNLYVDWIQVNGVTYQKNRAIIDRGYGESAYDGNDILPGGHLYWSGALRFVVGSGGTAMGYDPNGNMSYKLQAGEATIYEWNHENRLATVKRNGVTTDQNLYDANGQRVKKTSMAGGTTFYVNGRYELSNEEVWIDDAIPGGATLTNGEDGWNWDATEKVSGRTAHRSALQSGTHQHYFTNAQETMAVKSGDTLYVYIYLDPNNPPQEVMLQWNDGDWNQRAYWGQNLINWGTDGTSSRRYMGSLPASGGWVRLEVPAAQVGLEGKTVNGLAFTLYGGRAWWDRAGVRRAVHEATKYYDFNGQRIARRQDGVLTYLHTDHLGSTLLETNSSGAMLGDHRYQAYGSSRDGDELATDHRFTGQKQDGTGLLYYRSRYYDPAVGAFISPDTIVPDASLLIDYNRYAYVRGNVLNMNDPTGHTGIRVKCSLCNVEILDYSNSPGWLDRTADGLAVVGCFFAGCNVDTQTNTVTGLTEEEYFEQLGNDLITGGMMPIGTVTLATSRASRRLIQHGDELLGLSTAPRHVLNNALKGVNNRTLTSSGGNIVTLTKERLGHILTRHHPTYWGAWEHLGHRIRGSNSAFDAGLGIEDVIGLLQETLKASGQVQPSGSLKYIREIDGKWYSAVVEDSTVQNFVPCAIVGCQ